MNQSWHRWTTLEEIILVCASLTALIIFYLCEICVLYFYAYWIISSLNLDSSHTINLGKGAHFPLLQQWNLSHSTVMRNTSHCIFKGFNPVPGTSNQQTQFNSTLYYYYFHYCILLLLLWWLLLSHRWMSQAQ